MLILIKMQVTFALLLPCAEETVSRGELGHQQAAGGSFPNGCLRALRVSSLSFNSLDRSDLAHTVRLLLFRRLHYVEWVTDKTGMADKAAEDRIRHARHRRKHRGRRNVHTPDLEGL